MVRLSIFDMLGYLMGWDFHSLQEHRNWTLVEEFVASFDQWLERLLQQCDQYVLLSTYSHKACKAAVNLNAALERAGFASMLSPAELHMQADIRLRQQARAAIDQTTRHQTPLFFRFHTERTVAASPIYGQIYLNTRERFGDGILPTSAKDRVMEEVTQALNQAFEGSGLQLQLELTPQFPGAPDLQVKMPGVDLSSYGRASIEFKDKPRSVHCAEGFVTLPGAKLEHDQTLTPTLLNKILVEISS